jgi:hypothetical protein
MQRGTCALVVDLRFRGITVFCEENEAPRSDAFSVETGPHGNVTRSVEGDRWTDLKLAHSPRVLRGILLCTASYPRTACPFLSWKAGIRQPWRYGWKKLLCTNNYSSRGPRNRLWHLEVSHIPTAAVPRMPPRPRTPPPKLARKAAVCPLPPPMQEKMVTKLREMGFLTRAAEAWSADPLRSGWIEGFPSRIEGCGAKGGGHLMVRCVAKTCILVLGEIEVHATVPGWCSVCHLPSCREGGRKNRWADSK